MKKIAVLSVFVMSLFSMSCGSDSTPSKERIINVEAEADDDGETMGLASGMVVDGIDFPFEVRLPDINILAPSSAEKRKIESMQITIPEGLPCRRTQQAECGDFSCHGKFEMTDYGVCAIGIVGRTASGVVRTCHLYTIIFAENDMTSLGTTELNAREEAALDSCFETIEDL